MNVLKFTLSGRTAFFKRPDVNTYLYFTYGNIHKVSLLGMLGAIMGYGGYNRQKPLGAKEFKQYPEFYDKLQHIKVSIVPKCFRGYIPKKVQVFNNSVGYGSQEKGGNLIVKEQWLENPKWDIYILIEDEVTKKLSERIKSYTFKYIPYLGKNDHLADITNVEILNDVKAVNQVSKLDSLFIKSKFNFVAEDEDDDERDELWKYEENLPQALDSETNQYKLETFVLTNSCLKPMDKDDLNVYLCNDKSLFFF